MQYRPEIDGLRALAVVPVILFHAGVSGFSGGFVGVDVFFVISGFLITGILIDDLERGKFSLAYFYERRIRRILPALFAVMIVCMPLAWLWLLPDQLLEFSESVIATVFFVSNIFFWSKSGYFETAAEEKPLLHTWSLAVEEQFYIFFPILLLYLWKYRKSLLVHICVFLGIMSFVLCEIGWREAASANFYLAPARGWELLSGAIAALITRKKQTFANNTLSSFGLIAVVCSVFFYDRGTPFPSYYSLLPVLGTVLVLLYGSTGTLVATVLSRKPFVMIGLISYSAYLWHQPLFAFQRVRSLHAPDEITLLGLSFLSLVLAYLSWRFIEAPFRKHGFMSREKVFTALSFPAVILLVGGFVGSIYGSSPGLYFDWKDTSECVVRNGFDDDAHPKKISEKCFQENGRNFILVGDSHAESVSKKLREVIENHNGGLITLLRDACLPIPDTSRKPFQRACVKDKNDYWEFLSRTSATVIFAARWRLNLFGKRFNNGEGGVETGVSGQNYIISDENTTLVNHLIEQIRKLSKKKEVVVFSQIPEAGWHVPHRLQRLEKSGQINLLPITTSYEVYQNENKQILSMLEQLESLERVSVFRPEALVCDTSVKGRCLNTSDGVSLYLDDDHPSPAYAELIARAFEQHYLQE